jgi:hypothetical protein
MPKYNNVLYIIIIYKYYNILKNEHGPTIDHIFFLEKAFLA